ncbi:hypothetical protein PLEOSDRAFT_1079741 [Pleurotus ostreatus PC15]|uniref:Acid phosphatase n=1 Tax=Pleurotus ostreatus (strain PC15) TaxID=1137138 RepID=A0A067NF52_PLEO1|nr:hypothetical protein PLEOSDRAFT_1079741 [Pleurotus ostreatus PC15]
MAGVRPPQEPLDVENYPVAPKGLILDQVHVYVRHGERAPVGVRLADPPASIPSHWMLCTAARQFRAELNTNNGALDGDPLPLKRLVERKDGTSAEGECLLGELTDVGRKSTFEYGAALRRLYVERLGFLPDQLLNAEQAYFRSTNMPRTMESLRNIISGLYPAEKCPNTLPPILIRNGKDENLLGNTFSCKRLEILQIGFAQAAANLYNPALESLDRRLSKYIGGHPVRVDGKPRASGIMDTIRAASAHGIKVPPEFEEKAVVDLIEKAVVAEWFSDKTEEVRRLGMGLLLSDLSRKMSRKVSLGDQDPVKILVHSTHDTAIAALCSTLDVYDELWPPFTASITFELFSKSSEPSRGHPSYLQGILNPFRPREHYVRVRYQNKNMALPFCGTEGKHLSGHAEFCTLAAFQERVEELTPLDYDAECSIPRS